MRFFFASTFVLCALVTACGGPAPEGPGLADHEPPKEPSPPPPPQPTGAHVDPPSKSPGKAVEPGIDHTISPPNFVAIDDWSTHIGEGFDWTTKQFGGLCVVGATPFDFGGETHREAMEDEADWGLHFGLRLDFIDTTGFTVISLSKRDPRFQSFIAGAVVDDQSLTHIEAVTYELGDIDFLDNGARTKDGSCAASDFVRGAHFGARLAYGLKLRFHDTGARAAFVASHGPSMWNALIDVDRSTLAKELDGKAVIQLQVLQIGGTSSAALEEIVKSSTCSIGDLDACVKTQEALGAYVETFTKMLSPAPVQSGEPGALRGWMPYSLYTRPLAQVPQ